MLHLNIPQHCIPNEGKEKEETKPADGEEKPAEGEGEKPSEGAGGGETETSGTEVKEGEQQKEEGGGSHQPFFFSESYHFSVVVFRFLSFQIGCRPYCYR